MKNLEDQISKKFNGEKVENVRIDDEFGNVTATINGKKNIDCGFKEEYEQRAPYFVNQAIANDKGEFIPCIAVEGETGYHKTNWTWGKDFDQARKIASDMNEKMGITKLEAAKIVTATMRPL